MGPRRHPWNRGFEWHDHTGPLRTLDGGQVRHYDRHGYVVVPDLVPPELLAEVTAAIDPFDSAERLEGDPAAGPPTARVACDAPDRQFPVVVGGRLVG